jgi:Spy/CpxP family protein refolding chaperone
MKRIEILLLAVVWSLILSIGLVYGQSMGPGMMGHGGKRGGVKGHGIMGEKMMCGRMMPGMHGHRLCGMFWLMKPFHAWIAQVMANQQDLGLSPEQVQQLEGAITEHLKKAVRNRAEAQVLRIDLAQALREKSIDLPGVKDLLKKVADQDTELQVQGIELYVQVLQLLTDQQKEKVMELIGPPFPSPWENMAMGFGIGGATVVEGPSRESPPASHGDQP